MDDLQAFRTRMDGLSLEIVDLLLRRKRLAEQILMFKKMKGLPARDPIREEELLKLLTKDLGEKDSLYVQEVFQQILQHCRAADEFERGS